MDGDTAERLLEQALDIPPAQRGAFLDAACPEDPALRREMDDLLLYAESDPEFLAAPVVRRPGADLFELFNHREAAASQQERPLEINGYRILGMLGSGGMAVVYEARQQVSQRAVALKLLCPGPMTQSLRRRFSTEARLLARLRHPDIPRLIEAGVQEVRDPWGESCQLPFLVMELVRGWPLDAYHERVVLSVADRLRLFAAICDTVTYAHGRGVLHRDLKPANILVGDDGRPKILDFGIAKALETRETGDPTSTVTTTGQILGSLAYMSPEQINDSHAVDVQADVYALGVILYQMLAGRLPYDVAHLSIAEALHLVDSTLPPPLDNANRACGDDLCRITSRAMARDRAQRYACAADLAADVRKAVTKI